MENQILYEASFRFQRAWLLVAAFLAVWPWLLVRLYRNCRGSRKAVAKFEFTLGIFGALVLIMIFALVIPDQIRMYDATVGAYRRGDYRVVEGTVEDFHPMPKEGGARESFRIGDVTFAYSDFTVQFGYNKSRIRGGVITGDGQRLRIGYVNWRWLGNVIVLIEALP